MNSLLQFAQLLALRIFDLGFLISAVVLLYGVFTLSMVAAPAAVCMMTLGICDLSIRLGNLTFDATETAPASVEPVAPEEKWAS